MGGRKFLKLQTIPVWCFHLMTHHMSCVHIRPPAQPPAETIKLIKSDGVVKIYDKPIHVSDLLIEHPKHLVCKSDSFYIGQKIPPLAAGDQLQPGNNYFLLPLQYFQSVLSFVTIASFVASSSDSRNAVLKKAAACKPFDIQKSPSGILKIRVSDEFISKLIEEGGPVKESGEKDSSNKVCTTPQLQKEYGLLVRSAQWKPKLETIKEKEKRKISTSFGIKRRKKSQSKSTQKPTHNHKSSSSSSLKGKIKIKLRK